MASGTRYTNTVLASTATFLGQMLRIYYNSQDLRTVRAFAADGWENFGALTAHMHFIREHHNEVERVAIVTDSHFAGMAELLGTHFTSAEVRPTM